MKKFILAVTLMVSMLTVSTTAWAASHDRAKLSGVVNINQADSATLDLLPSIGETRAKAIIEWRHGHPFKKPDDLARVKGIGRKTMAKLRPYLTVAGETTLHASHETALRADHSK